MLQIRQIEASWIKQCQYMVSGQRPIWWCLSRYLRCQTYQLQNWSTWVLSPWSWKLIRVTAKVPRSICIRSCMFQQAQNSMALEALHYQNISIFTLEDADLVFDMNLAKPEISLATRLMSNWLLWHQAYSQGLLLGSAPAPSATDILSAAYMYRWPW